MRQVLEILIFLIFISICKSDSIKSRQKWWKHVLWRRQWVRSKIFVSSTSQYVCYETLEGSLNPMMKKLEPVNITASSSTHTNTSTTTSTLLSPHQYHRHHLNNTTSTSIPPSPPQQQHHHLNTTTSTSPPPPPPQHQHHHLNTTTTSIPPFPPQHHDHHHYHLNTITTTSTSSPTP